MDGLIKILCQFIAADSTLLGWICYNLLLEQIISSTVVALFSVTPDHCSSFLFWDEDWQPPPDYSDHPTDEPSICARPSWTLLLLLVVVLASMQYRSEATVTFPIFWSVLWLRLDQTYSSQGLVHACESETYSLSFPLTLDFVPRPVRYYLPY